MFLYINIALIIIIAAMLGWSIYKSVQVRRGSKKVDNEEFAELIPKGQLIDIREPAEFRIEHIMGARNIPASQIKQSLGALSKNKPVLLYEMGKPQKLVSVVPVLRKAGFEQVYVLKTGLTDWNGKVKKGE